MKNYFLILSIFIILFVLTSADVVGLISVLVVTLFIFFLGKRYPSVAPILYVALFTRLAAILLDNNLLSLPDSQGDARIFELQAYEWSRAGFPDVLNYYPGWADSFLISYMISIFYSILDRSMLLAQSFSLLFGTLSVFMSWLLAQKLWSDKTAIKVGWFSALFPSLILYSALVMREMYISFFLLVALNYVVNWFRNGSVISFFLVIFNLMIATIFHGGMFVGIIIFLILAISFKFKKVFSRLISGLISLKSLIYFSLAIFLVIFSTLNNVFIPKLGIINDFNVLKKEILKKNLVSHRGSAKYPSWVVAESEKELLYKIPIRAIYFIFSPFPWDVKKPSHLLGMFDGFLFMFLGYLIFKNRKVIWADPVLRTILLILISYIFVYGIATGNFGTGLRHRTKFVIMVILLAASLLPRFTFSKKKNKRE